MPVTHWRCYGLDVRVEERAGMWYWAVVTPQHEQWVVRRGSNDLGFVCTGSWCYTRREAVLRASARAVAVGRGRVGPDGDCYLDILYSVAVQ